MRKIVQTDPTVKVESENPLGSLMRAATREALAVLGPLFPPPDPWVTRQVFEAETGLKWRRVLDGGKRGELQLFKLGDAVVCKRSELDRWIEAHPVAAKVVAEAGESDEDLYLRMAGGSK